MRYRKLDLNLLVALEALLTLRSITRAAERLHLSQPAMSAALSRLRQYFNDDLLILEGRRFFPTAVGEALLPLVREWLGGAEAIIAAAEAFDPATSRRRFQIMASDYTAVVLLSAVAQGVSAAAPGITVDILTPAADALRQLEQMDVDLVIGPQSYLLPIHPTEALFSERMVVVGWSQNPIFAEPMTREQFEASGHVVASFGPDRVSAFGDQQIEALGVERRVEVRTSSFSLLPWFLPGTTRLAIMHERLAKFFAAIAPLAIADPPFALPRLEILMQYHRARRDDVGLAWMRSRIQSAAAEYRQVRP